MKALICIPCLLRGGTEMQTLMLVRALISSGHSVNVCCYHETDAQVAAEFRSAGAQLALPGWPRTLTPPEFVRKLASVVRRERPDVGHIQYMAPGLLPIIAARTAGLKRVVATVHQPATRYHGSSARLLLRLGASLCRHFVCVSEAAERSWFGSSNMFDTANASAGLPKHLTIPNGVDVDRIRSILAHADAARIRKSLGLCGRPVIGTVSRLSFEKGIDVLLEAFARLRAKHPDARLLIAGEGNRRVQLREASKTLGVADSVIWTGRQPWHRAIEQMSLMDIVASPSRFEGFGLAAAEAMACGKPVVASDVYGLREVVDVERGAGCLVPAGQPGPLADRCAALLNNHGLRIQMGAIGKKRVEELYGMKIFGERYRALYERVASSDS